MPFVRITGWQEATVPSHLAEPLRAMLAGAGDFDNTELSDMVKRLIKGKSVDVHFDPGDEEAARAFMTSLSGLGLSSVFRNRQRPASNRPRISYGFGRALISIIAGIISYILSHPWVGLLLLAIGVGGILCALVIRWNNERADRELELLESLGRPRDAG